MPADRGAETLLIVQCGSTHPRVRARFGDYDRWFSERLGVADDRVRTIRPFLGEQLPSYEGLRGILLSGSPASVRDEAPWMKELGRWALEANRRGIPVLGVCFGHQLLAEALGGRIEPSPAGWEFGTVEVDLTEAGRGDPLFEGLPARFLAHTVHREEIVAPPRDVLRLAGNAHSAWQAFAAGARLRGVQFHLEISESILEALADALDVRASVRPTDVGARILENWKRHFLRAGA